MAFLSAWTPAAQVARRHGNADLRSAQPAAGGRREGLRPPDGPPLGVDPSSAGGAQARERRPPVGTARRRRADGKDPAPPDGLPLGVDPSSAGGAQARERRPPVGTARRRRADGKDPDLPVGSPVGVDPSSAGGAQARERRPPVGTARRRRADEKDPAPGWPSSRRGPQQRRWRAGPGTPTSGRSAPSASPNPDPKRAHSRNSPLPKTPYLPSPRTSSVRKSSCLPTAQKFVSLDSGARHSPPQAGGWEGPRSPGWLPSRRGPQ